MRLAKREITDADELRALVERAQVVRIGAVDSQGVFVVPVNFGFEWVPRENASDGPRKGEAGSPSLAGNTDYPTPSDADHPLASEKLVLWLHSAGKGRKAEAFSAGGAAGVTVAIEMDFDNGNITSGGYACAYSRAYASIMGSGRIFPVEDENEKVHGLTLLMQHTAPDAPTDFAPEALVRTAVFRIETETLTGKKREPKQ